MYKYYGETKAFPYDLYQYCFLTTLLKSIMLELYVDFIVNMTITPDVIAYVKLILLPHITNITD